MKCLLKAQKGFTLIELIIVLVITGILASVAYPAYSRYLSDAEAMEGEVVVGAMVAAMKSARQQVADFNAVDLKPVKANAVHIDTVVPTVGTGLYKIGTVIVDTGEGPTFEYEFTIVTATTFTIEARGRGINGFESTDKLTLTYNAAGTPSRVTVSATGKLEHLE